MGNHQHKQGQRAVVIGAGIVGLTTALRLAEAGYVVEVVERETEVCVGSSKANAGQLLYDRIGAMGSAGFLRSVPATMFNPDQGVSVFGLANPARWPWAGAFLRQCTTQRWQENTHGLLDLATRSRRVMAVVSAQYGLSYDWRKPGKLIVHPTAERLAAADRAAQFQAQFGGRHEVLGHEACLEHEPALRSGTRAIAGGMYLPDAQVGDCRKFGQGIAQVLAAKFGVRIRYGVQVCGLVQNGGRVSGLRSDQGLIEGDVFVVATGKAAGELLRGGFAGKRRITGVKGVSLTYPAGDVPPDVSVTDAEGKFVVMRLGDRVRVAGYAIFLDGDAIKAKYVQRLAYKARALMPRGARYDITPDVWVGIRPQTPDDLPMIGQAGAANLFVNAGHGSLGWTLAAGSAEVLAERIAAAGLSS